MLGMIRCGCSLLGIITVLLASCEGLSLNISSLLVPPYLRRVSGVAGSSDPKNYEGFMKDVLDEMSKLVPFNYTLHVPSHGIFGTLRNGTWDGIVGEVVNYEVDMAAAPLTVTSTRTEAVDFSIPIQNFGPVIVMKKPTSYQPSLGDRLSRVFTPLDQSVWLLSILAYLAVSTIVYVICHCNPYEWRRMAKDGEATVREAESFTCYNSFWFLLSAWAWQGYVRAPRSLGGRIVVMSWWVYIMMFVLTFTASLTNMLRMGPTPEDVREFTRIRSLDDLTKQTDIEFGMLQHGSTYQYFENAKVPNLIRIHEMVRENPDVLEKTISDGINRVRTSWRKDYAFIMESAMAKYYSKQEPCDLFFVGDFTTTSSYSFAYSKNWKHAKELDIAILLLRENGILRLIEEKWFAGKCDGFMINPSQDDVFNLPPYYTVDLGSFSGALILLLIGVLLGAVVTIAEVVIYRKVELPKTEARRELVADNQQPLSQTAQTKV
ncbi:glutamate receptor 2-like isoform X1 [Haliotis rubra]|uniref:glutamate receptor 2-like isoform X1 n=1 Tax=Haliotis rubra TaxID=36100 RepID=UPI001EE62900|nr:glutamate receptor 2-like isoform X1 [Haliotis rubra]